MADSIDQAAAALGDAKAAWVTRRDAAEFLGKVAGRAVAALKANDNEKDVDVHAAVAKALGHAGAALTGVTPVQDTAGSGKGDLAALIRGCEKDGVRTIFQDGEGFRVDVVLPKQRKQMVCVHPIKRPDGLELVHVESICGAVDPATYAWALRANKDLLHCAIALDDRDQSTPRLILRSNFVLNELSAQTLKASVKEAAFYADWIEGKSTGKDGF